MKFLWVALIYVTSCNIAIGQDALERYEQFQAESEVMNSPSCVFLDATRIKSSEKKGEVVQTRSIGRRVVGSKGEVRVDLRETVKRLNSERTQFKHFVRFGHGDYLQALQPYGMQFVVFDPQKNLREGDQPMIPAGFSNPFLVVLGGDLAFNGASSLRPYALVSGIDSALRPAGDQEAKVIQNFKFLQDTPWAITSWKSAVNPKRFDPKLYRIENGQPTEGHLAKWADLKKPKEYVEDWNVFASGSVDWVEVDKVGKLPARIVCQFGVLNDFDDVTRDFEVIYFGYDFDIKSIEKLFDRNRFNEADIKQDFPIESILEKAEIAQKAVENKAGKKSNRK